MKVPDSLVGVVAVRPGKRPASISSRHVGEMLPGTNTANASNQPSSALGCVPCANWPFEVKSDLCRSEATPQPAEDMHEGIASVLAPSYGERNELGIERTAVGGGGLSTTKASFQRACVWS